MPFPEWEDPLKERIGELLDENQGRLRIAGLEGIESVIDLVPMNSAHQTIDAEKTDLTPFSWPLEPLTPCRAH